MKKVKLFEPCSICGTLPIHPFCLRCVYLKLRDEYLLTFLENHPEFELEGEQRITERER